MKMFFLILSVALSAVVAVQDYPFVYVNVTYYPANSKCDSSKPAPLPVATYKLNQW
jgi:hypothetical protein